MSLTSTPRSVKRVARGLDVGDDEVRAAVRARLGTRDALPDGDRARRSRRSHLHYAELVIRGMVDVEAEADLLRIERLRPIHVRDRDEHQLELEVHLTPFVEAQAKSA